MADQKITELTAITTCNLADLLAIVDDVAGTPVTRKITIDDLFTQEGIITITPGAGSDLAIELSTTGDLVVNTTQFVVDTSASRVGIGTATPASQLDVSGGIRFGVDSFASNVAQLYTDADVGVSLTGVAGASYDIAISESGGQALLVNPQATNHVALVPISGGRVGIGIVAPTAKTHIDQSSDVGAIPVLLLDQADLSEEMIEFTTTVGTGNPVEAVALKTLTTTHFIRVTVTGVGYLYIPAGTIA